MANSYKCVDKSTLNTNEWQKLLTNDVAFRPMQTLKSKL